MNELFCGMMLSSAIDDFGNVVTLCSWQAIVARMDFILSATVEE
jgi:hypothetical protein